jgi:hypothetical protein
MILRGVLMNEEKNLLDAIEYILKNPNALTDIDYLKNTLNQMKDLLETSLVDQFKGKFRNKNYHILAEKYIQSFTAPVYIFNNRLKIHNGSCVFIKMDKFLMVTNHHVVNFYEEKKKEDKNWKFQIFDYVLPIEDLKIDSNTILDLATIQLPDHYSDNLADNCKTFFYPDNWPSEKIQKDDVIILAGYPKDLRIIDGISCCSKYKSICEAVEDSGFQTAIITFDRNEWINTLGLKCKDDLLGQDGLSSVGGMSGGPAFKFIDGKPILVGIIVHNGRTFFDMQIVHSSFINPDGTIQDIS